MNTPAHMLLGWALLARDKERARVLASLVGGLLPDLPMFVFYVYEGMLRGAPESRLWSELYFNPNWQAVFDLFNSVPIIAIVLLIGLRLRSPVCVMLCASMLLHCAVDFPLHHDDGHRYFYPLSSFQFQSPVSYWDPRHGGVWGALLETVCVVASVGVLWPHRRRRWARGLLVAVALLQVTGYVWLYVLGGA